MNRTPSKPLYWTLLLLTLSATLGLPILGCGALFQKGTEVLKEKAAAAVEDKAKSYGLDLKEKYGIDPVNDAPQLQVMKIIKTEIQAGHGELASLLADVEKTKTLGDAIQLVVLYQKLLYDKEKQGGVTQDAIDTAKRIQTGLGGLGAFASLTTLLSYLKGQKYKDAALLVMEKVEEARVKGHSADQIVDNIAGTNGSRKATAQLVGSLTEKHFPESTEMARAQYLAGELAKKIAAGRVTLPQDLGPLPSI